jgi:hypothetical protein
MDQDNKNTTGAPSNDTTSALFVSARKKQLEQQEADRRAKEKEEQRIAAEAEVRRLEREVEERRRKVEEDRVKTEEEAKRIAQEARAKQAQAAADPDAVLGAAPPPKKEIKLPQMPKIPKISMPHQQEKPASGGAVAASKLPLSPKMLAIIGGGVAAVILIIVLVMTMGGGGGTTLDNSYRSNSLGLELAYPTGWLVEEDAAQSAVTLQDGETGLLMIIDATDSVYEYGSDVISAAEAMMQMIVMGLGNDEADMPLPTLQKTGDYVSGGVEFETGDVFIKLQAEAIEDRLIIFVHTVKIAEREAFEKIASEIAFSLSVDSTGGTTGDAEEAAGGSGSYSGEYVSFNYPDGWYYTEMGDAGRFVGTVIVSPIEDFSESDIGKAPFILIADFTDAWNESEEAALEDGLTDFTEGIIEALSLSDILGEPGNVEYLGEESLTNASGVGYGVTLTLGDTVCLSQLAFTDGGRAYGSITVGIADEYNADIDAILTTITE